MKIFLFLLIVFLISCGKKEQSATEFQNTLATELAGQAIFLKDFVSAKPADILSSRSAIELEFKQNMVLQSVIGKDLQINPIDFEPAIKGNVKWLTTSLLQFTPNEPLKNGQAYKAKFNGKKAFGNSASVDDYNFDFKIIPNEILEITGDFEPISEKLNTAKLVLELRFSDKPDSAKLAKDLVLNFNSKKIPYKISFDEQGNFVKIESENITRTNNAQNAEIALPKTWTASGYPFSETFLLPAIGNFVPISVKESSSEKDEKALEIIFSDQIANNIDLSGFISISPEVTQKFAVKNKTLVSVKNKTLKIKGDFSYGTQYTIQIEKGFPSAYGTKTESNYIKQFLFSDENPQVKLIGNGLFLPLENKGRLQLKSINVASVKLEIQEILPQNLMFFLQNNDLRASDYWISDINRTAKIVYSGTILFDHKKTNRNEWLKTEIDISKYITKKAGAAYIINFAFGLNNLIAPCKNTDQEYTKNDLVYESNYYTKNPCYNNYYQIEHRNLKKILIASSVALTTKKESQGFHIWATDVETSKPISNLKLELYGKVNDTLDVQKTNSNGYVFFPNNKNGDAYVVKGQGNKGLALLKLNQNNWETSRFDVGGVKETNNNARLFSFTERGVYRPGDTIHFAGIVREAIGKPSFTYMPMSIEVKNPMGSVVFEGSAKTLEHGMFSLDIPIDLNAPTGQWLATIKSGGNKWEHDLQVETVKPNRLKNILELPEKLIGSEIKINETFQSKYLFGTPAAGLKTNIDFNLISNTLKFPRFSDFTFRNQMIHFENRDSENLFKGNLNSEGEAKISKTINLKNRNIPEKAILAVHAVVNETGGGYTESRHFSVVYPYPVFVGLKIRDSWEGVRTGDTLRIPIITVDENGKIVPDRKLSVNIYQNRRYSWWEGDDDERWDFRKQEQTYIVHKETIRSGSSIKEFKWVPENDGLISIEIEDVEGGHSTSQFVYASYWGDSENTRNIPEASHLNLMSQKQNYNIGDSIFISFEAPANGNALVSLEYSNKILETKLVQATAGKNIVSFVATKDMLPNVYAVVSLFLPLKSVEGEKPMRYYGVLPIKVEDENTKLNLALKVPKEIKPGEEFSIEVANNSKENASFTLAVVDEGLLDLTNFKTPDPWKFYFQKMALRVRTSDNYDEIIGALMPDMDSYLSIGGGMWYDEGSSRAGKQKTQRFKAVSLFSGVQEVNAGKTKNIKFIMPQYIGSVRVQLIGASANAFSTNEDVITVKKPLVILPTVPRVAKIGDKFKIPVSVFAMDNDVKNVNVNIQVSKELKIIGKNNFTISFEKPGELDGDFEVETMPILGSAKIIVKAESGKHKISDTIDLPIMSSSAIYTEILQKQILESETWQTKINAFGIDNTHKATLVLSTMPSLGIDERLDYLINYPYGCLEQTISGMFPQLYIDKLRDLDSKKKQEISNNINGGIKMLAQFSMDKGFSYWPNQSERYADSWSTSYAGHFMLEAKNAGYSIPQNLLNAWKTWELEQAKKTYSKDFRNQAYRLFLLAIAGEGQMGAMNLMKENNLEKLDWLSKYLLAGAYHAAGKETIAKQVLEHSGNILNDYRENSGTYGSTLRDQALAALVLAKMGKFTDALNIYQNLAKEWNSKNWWSTQESAFALLAFSALKDKFSSGDVEAQFDVNGKTEKILIKANKPAKIDLSSFGSADVSVNALNGTVFAEIQTKGLPLEDNVKTESKGLVIERGLFSQNGESISKSQIKQGDVFWILFGVKSLSATKLENLALSSILPSSFEISNERLNEYNRPEWLNNRISTPDYMDIRDDRINWFFSINPNETKVFAVQIHSSYAGEFRWPGLVLEAMYNPDYFARIKGERISISP